MASLPKNILGIDVAKNKVDTHLLPAGRTGHVGRTRSALKRWIKTLGPVDLAVMESTGGLEKLVAEVLEQAGIPVAVVNPARVHYFAKATGSRAKTDPVDAALIAEFGLKMRPRPRVRPSVAQARLTGLCRRRDELVVMRAAEKTRLSSATDRETIAGLRRHFRFLSREIARLEAKIDSLVRSEDRWAETAALVRSVTGVGKKTAWALLAHLPELGSLTRRQAAALAGLAPYARDSGQWQGRRFISGGRAELRRGVYMAAVSASQHNPVLREFYRRLIQAGKPPKLALTAVMRRLLVILNAIVRDGQIRQLGPQNT